MRRVFAAAVVVALVFSGVSLWAQSETFIGTVKSVNGSSVTVERGALTGVFAVDSKTHVGVAGATAKTKEAQAAGKPGITVADVLRAGDQVKVRYTYSEATNKMVVGDITVMQRATK